MNASKRRVRLIFTEGHFRLDGRKIEFKEAARFEPWADERALRVINRAFVKRYSLPSAPLPPYLDAVQVDGVRWILSRSRSYLAHAPGAGKTCQAATAAFLAPKEAGGALFIVPPSLTFHWARELWKFYGQWAGLSDWPSISIVPESRLQSFTGWGAEFLIVPDSMLTREWVLTRLLERRNRLIAVDEASRFKDPLAQRTRALFGGTLEDGRKSSGIIHTGRHVVLLDGSPMPNRPMELWAPTYAMFPEAIDFMSQQDFGFRYCGARLNQRGEWEFKHSVREAELQKKLQSDFMQVVGEEKLNHPERRRSWLYMSGDPRSPRARYYERKLLSNLNLDDPDEKLSQGKLAKMRKTLGIQKAPWVASYVASRLEEKNEFIILFAWHREVCLELAKRLKKYNPGVVMGGTDPNSREGIFTSFQDGARRLIIGNIAAMGRGHNLQRADRVVFAEFSWTDELNKQCEKRASRKGSDKLFVRCDYVVAPNSMDETILRAVMMKAARVKKVIG